jgi:hypothetical protein
MNAVYSGIEQMVNPNMVAKDHVIGSRCTQSMETSSIIDR